MRRGAHAREQCRYETPAVGAHARPLGWGRLALGTALHTRHMGARVRWVGSAPRHGHGGRRSDHEKAVTGRRVAGSVPPRSLTSELGHRATRAGGPGDVVKRAGDVGDGAHRRFGRAVQCARPSGCSFTHGGANANVSSDCFALQPAQAAQDRMYTDEWESGGVRLAMSDPSCRRLLHEQLEVPFAPTACEWTVALVVAKYAVNFINPEVLPKLPGGQARPTFGARYKLTTQRLSCIAADEQAIVSLIERVCAIPSQCCCDVATESPTAKHPHAQLLPPQSTSHLTSTVRLVVDIFTEPSNHLEAVLTTTLAALPGVAGEGE